MNRRERRLFERQVKKYKKKMELPTDKQMEEYIQRQIEIRESDQPQILHPVIVGDYVDRN
jgi:hypothetical protein